MAVASGNHALVVDSHGENTGAQIRNLRAVPHGAVRLAVDVRSSHDGALRVDCVCVAVSASGKSGEFLNRTADRRRERAWITRRGIAPTHPGSGIVNPEGHRGGSAKGTKIGDGVHDVGRE